MKRLIPQKYTILLEEEKLTISSKTTSGLWKKVLSKLARKHLKIETKTLKISDAGKGLYKALIINNVIILYDGQIYYKPTDSILLGACVPEPDMLGFIYFLFRQAKIEKIDIYDPEQKMKIFGILLSISSSYGTYYAGLPEKLTDEEEKIVEKLNRGVS